MKNIVIIGGGTGGTIVANRLARRLPKEWSIKVIDPNVEHLYQPGLLFLPFGAYDEKQLLRPRAQTFEDRVEWIQEGVSEIDTNRKSVLLSNQEEIEYDLLVIASGARIRPDLTEGLLDEGWLKDRFEFYTLAGAKELRGALEKFEGGRLLVNVVEMPIKCPVAPLEFLFLADEYFTRRGIREKVDLRLVTPLDGAFTKPIAKERLGHLLEQKKISLETEFSTARVDGASKKLFSWDERSVEYDLLVSIPTHSGDSFVERSGIGNELSFVPVDPRTLAVRGAEGVFALGDATDAPTSKAGSVAHFQAECLTENLLRIIDGKSPEATFDGHANCFVETGFGKALLIDFNYDVEPLPGHYPLPGVGPFTLLGESRRNHFGKLAFRWIYWNGLLPGRPMPVPTQMSMRGKQRPQASM